MADLPISLLFWNIQQRPEAFESVVRLANSLAVHILLIAEMPLPDEPGLVDHPTAVLCEALNQPAPIPSLPKFRLISEPRLGSKRHGDEDIVQVYSRLPGSVWRRRTIDDRYTLWEIDVPDYRRFHLAAVHFTSIQNDLGDEQRQCAVALRHDLERAERAMNKRIDGEKAVNRFPL